MSCFTHNQRQRVKPAEIERKEVITAKAQPKYPFKKPHFHFVSYLGMDGGFWICRHLRLCLDKVSGRPHGRVYYFTDRVMESFDTLAEALASRMHAND